MKQELTYEYIGKVLYEDDKLLVKLIGHTETDKILSIKEKNGE